MSPVKLPISRSTCLKISPGLSPTSFLKSPVLLSNIKVWSCSLSLSLWCHTKHPKECIANPNHKHSKPKLRILRLETQITKLDIEMNRSRLSLNWSHGGSWWLLMLVTIWKKGWERKNAWERNRSGKGRKKREKKRKPDLVVARDGDDWFGGGGLWRSNEGLVRRESSG